MFCKNCGANVPDNNAFCTQCGARMTEPVSEAPSEVSLETPVNTFTEEPLEVSANNASFAEMAPISPKKKRSVKKPLFISLAVIVTLIAGTTIGAFASQTFRNTLFRTFMSDKQYFNYVMSNGAESASKDLSEAIGIYKNSNRYKITDQTAKGDMTIKVGDAFHDMVYDLGGSDAKEATDWIDSAGITYDMGITQNAFSGDFGIELNGVNMTDANIAMDLDNGYMYMSVPELSDTAVRQYTGLDADAISQLTALSNEIVEIMPDEKVTKDIFSRYAKCVVKSIDEVEQTREKIEIEDVSQKVTVFTAKIDGQTMLNIGEAVLTEVKDDKEIEKIINNMASTDFAADSGVDADELYNDFVEEVEYALDELEDVDADDLEDVEFNAIVYANNKGEIIGFGIEHDYFDARFITLEKGKDFAVSILVSSGSAEFEISGSGTNNGDLQTAEYHVKANNNTILNISVSNLNTKKYAEGTLDGTITVTVDSGLVNLLDLAGMDELTQYLNGAELVIKGTDTSASITFNLNGEMFMEISANYTITDGANISLPTNYVDMSSYGADQQWLETVNPNFMLDMFDKLKNAGVPADIIDPAREEYELSMIPDSDVPEDMDFDDFDFSSYSNQYDNYNNYYNNFGYDFSY